MFKWTKNNSNEQKNISNEIVEKHLNVGKGLVKTFSGPSAAAKTGWGADRSAATVIKLTVIC